MIKYVEHVGDRSIKQMLQEGADALKRTDEQLAIRLGTAYRDPDVTTITSLTLAREAFAIAVKAADSPRELHAEATVRHRAGMREGLFALKAVDKGLFEELRGALADQGIQLDVGRKEQFKPDFLKHVRSAEAHMQLDPSKLGL
jgi:hypothetical protein